MHQTECKHHHQYRADYPAFNNQNELGKVYFSTNGKANPKNPTHNRLGGGCGNSEKCGQGHEKTGAYQSDTNGEIVQIRLYEPLSNGFHDVLPLEHGSHNGKHGHQNRSISKGNQAAPNRRSYAVGRVISPDIPTNVCTGAQ